MIARKSIAAILVAELLFSACSGSMSSTGSGTASNAYHAQARMDALVAAPCPAPDAVNPLAGIEGWAPGAGHAAEMGQTAAQNFGGFGGALSGGSSTPTPAPTSTANNCKQLSPDAAAAFAGFATLKAQAYTAGYDVGARAAEFHDVQSAFAYVRDGIRTDPYAGAMRGAQGTLMARAGSPADKAALLAALLAAQGASVRYAHATLSDADCQQLLSATANVAPGASSSPAAQVRVNQPLDAALADARRMLATLQPALASANTPITGDPAIEQQLVANVRDHWWLQIQQDGAWVDADPSLPNASLGTHLGGAAADTPDQLPDSIQATVAIRLLADTGDAQNPQVLAQASAQTAKAAAVPITVSINGSVSSFTAIASQTSFPTNITIGSDSTDGQAIVPDDPSGRLRVLYLETTLQTDGAPPRTQRHIVIDRRMAGGSIDPAWTPARTAYALTTAYHGMETAGDIDPAFAVTQMLDALTKDGLALDFAAQHPGGTALPEGALVNYPIDALRYFVYDAAARLSLSQAGPAVHFIFDHPQVAFSRQGFAQNAGAFELVAGFDIVDNAMLAVGPGASAAAQQNAIRGLVDTKIESYLLGRGGEQYDTSALFAAADAQNIARAVITAKTISQAPPLSRDVLSQSLGGSGVAYAPVSKVPLNGRSSYGWLAIDTRSGNVVGRMSSGAGGAMVEYVLEHTREDWPYVNFIGSVCKCWVAGVARELQAGGPGHLTDENLEKTDECIGEAICDLILDLIVSGTLKGGAAMMEYTKHEIEFLENVLNFLSKSAEKTGVSPIEAICSGGKEGLGSSEGGGGE